VSTPQQRFDVLDAAGAEILAHKNDVGDLLAREESKTLLESIGEVVRAANVFKFLAGEALRVGADIVASVRPGVGIEVTREPGGVVGLITPWNFPIAIPAWKIALALAYGNAVVLKPADLVPGCAWAIADFLHRAGLPAGVFNLLMAAAPRWAKCYAVSFTGSVATGRRIAQACVARMANCRCRCQQRLPLHWPALHGFLAPDR
jgi:aldehyde dehydrogenase (NAD+)